MCADFPRAKDVWNLGISEDYLNADVKKGNEHDKFPIGVY